jgi:hypothetical protein
VGLLLTMGLLDSRTVCNGETVLYSGTAGNGNVPDSGTI